MNAPPLLGKLVGTPAFASALFESHWTFAVAFLATSFLSPFLEKSSALSAKFDFASRAAAVAASVLFSYLVKLVVAGFAAILAVELGASVLSPSWVKHVARLLVTVVESLV